MAEPIDDALRQSVLFRRLKPDDRQRVAAVATVRAFDKGAMLFSEGDGSDLLYTVLTGRVKVFKTTARGTDVILELFGPGESVGAVAVYEARPYPASALALEPTSCLVIPRQAFFSLLEGYPTMVRGLLVGLTHRLVELTNRLTELSGGRIEGRLARFILKLGTDMGRRLHPAGAVAPGARRHDRHDDRDIDTHHEPVGQGRRGPNGQGRVRDSRSRRARSCGHVLTRPTDRACRSAAHPAEAVQRSTR
jgi:CRP/FNR family transcriptional regulator